ncbi:MAG: integration host factor subunit beta [Fibromonadaceae bacterium]|jgi:DNA-binding protein HU-beta/integration host factor subunit beta|nr:integration host factor subunit beta [Fibromonadaceae bacterium]
MRSNNNVTKKKLVDEISSRTGLPQIETKKIVECFLDSVARTLIEGNNIEIRGFGRFKIRNRNSYKARNPRTGEPIEVQAVKRAVFEPSKELRKVLNTAIQ